MLKGSAFEPAAPYEIMVGVWTGHSILYDKKGHYMHTGPSMVSIYWKERGRLLHYKQEDLGNLDDLVLGHEHEHALKELVFLREFDLEIDGKACRSTGGDVKVEGVESRPGVYLFHLTFPNGHYYNNQYFDNPNERHIIGPFVPKDGSDIGAVVAQTFTRISYDVPDDQR